jgi:hypothetical protein
LSSAFGAIADGNGRFEPQTNKVLTIYRERERERVEEIRRVRVLKRGIKIKGGSVSRIQSSSMMSISIPKLSCWSSAIVFLSLVSGTKFELGSSVYVLLLIFFFSKQSMEIPSVLWIRPVVHAGSNKFMFL